jgi:coniferyl-aldehyde dehydrogenase
MLCKKGPDWALFCFRTHIGPASFAGLQLCLIGTKLLIDHRYVTLLTKEGGKLDRVDNLQLVASQMQQVFNRQQAHYRLNPSPSKNERIEHLHVLEEILLRHETDLINALSDDYGYRSRHESTMLDIVSALATIRHNRKHVGQWMKPRPVATPLQLRPSVSYIQPQPLGVVGIITAWNFPVYMSFAGLASALAAGNCCMLKPSEHTPRTSALMARLLESSFGQELVAVIEGDVHVATAFSKLPFDHLTFVGSQRVGRLVALAAAENLTPVTLELGGKSPLIIAPSGSIEQAAACAVQGKMINAGQVCVSPDHVYVPRAKFDAFVQAVRLEAHKQYPSVQDNPDVSCVINNRQMARLYDLRADARLQGAEVVEINPANEPFDAERRKFPLTLVLKPTPTMRVMQEEVFGPILPVIAYDDLQELVGGLQTKARPLALYLFVRKQAEKDLVLSNTVSGGVTVNDAMWHVMNNNMPFGGVGASGMGAYHGKAGFDNLSQLKPVLEQARVNAAPLLRAPYGTLFEKVVTVLKKIV